MGQYAYSAGQTRCSSLPAVKVSMETAVQQRVLWQTI
jgi:hypothetical protein